MMAQSRAESTRDTYNYGQYTNQFPLNTIKVIQEFERIQKKICRHKMSIMLNEICINEEMLPIYIYIYIYILYNVSFVSILATAFVPQVLLCLFVCLWWRINLCRLFNAKSIFIQINSSISSNSV